MSSGLDGRSVRDRIPSLGAIIGTVLVAAVPAATVIGEGRSGWSRVGATSISNCMPSVDLTGTGVAEIVVAVVTAVASAFLVRSWNRAGSRTVLRLLAGVIVMSW